MSFESLFPVSMSSVWPLLLTKNESPCPTSSMMMASSCETAREQAMKRATMAPAIVTATCPFMFVHAIQRRAAINAVTARAAMGFMEKGMHEHGMAASMLTMPASAQVETAARSMNAEDTGRAIAPASDAMRPRKQMRGNNGAQTTFAKGPIIGKMWKTEHAYSWESKLAASVIESASATGCICGMGNESNQNLKSGENSTMPIVERADKASDTDSDELGEERTIRNNPTPRALRAEGLLCPKMENMLIAVMTVARIAETGAPEKTRYDIMTMARMTMVIRRLARKWRKMTANRPVTTMRWAPETATRCAKPQD